MWTVSGLMLVLPVLLANAAKIFRNLVLFFTFKGVSSKGPYPRYAPETLRTSFKSS